MYGLRPKLVYRVALLAVGQEFDMQNSLQQKFVKILTIVLCTMSGYPPAVGQEFDNHSSLQLRFVKNVSFEDPDDPDLTVVMSG